jgi:hypothetical protein
MPRGPGSSRLWTTCAWRRAAGHWIELLQVLKAHQIPYTDIHFY